MSLPGLPSDIPQVFTVPGEQLIATPMAIAMIEYGMITDHAFRPKDGTLVQILNAPNEKELVETALTDWWRRKTKPLKLFQWNLNVHALRTYSPTEDPWFVVSANAFIPQRLLARPIRKLERIHPGFGQTVLAVLYDAFDYMPVAWTPQSVLCLASFVHWAGADNEDEFIEEQLNYGDCASREEFLAHNEVFQRADFFRNMPEWVAQPQRVCSRTTLERAASSALGKNVIAACDAIHAVVTSPTFTLSRWDMGVNGTECDPVEACILLRWSDRDVCTRTVDDALNDFSQGECIEAIHAQPIAPTPASLRKVLGDIEQMLAMATAIERLLLLISTPAREGN
jgi:PRTRC genetic system protein F